jgi:hypothetical protein
MGQLAGSGGAEGNLLRRGRCVAARVLLSVLFALVVPCMGMISCRHSSYRVFLLKDNREIQQDQP